MKSLETANPSDTEVRASVFTNLGVIALLNDDKERASVCFNEGSALFANPEKPRPATGPASILDWFEVYARRDAAAIGARYAQPFYSTSPLKIGDPMSLVRDVVPRP